MATKETEGAAVKEILRRELPRLQAEFGVKRLGLFGSFARGRQNKSSDIDLLIEFDTPIGLEFMRLVEYLEKKTGRKVDILTPDGVASIRIKSIADNILRGVVYV